MLLRCLEHVTNEDITIITTRCQPSQLFHGCSILVEEHLSTFSLVLRGFLFTASWHKIATRALQGVSDKCKSLHPCFQKLRVTWLLRRWWFLLCVWMGSTTRKSQVFRTIDCHRCPVSVVKTVLPSMVFLPTFTILLTIKNQPSMQVNIPVPFMVWVKACFSCQSFKRKKELPRFLQHLPEGLQLPGPPVVLEIYLPGN